MKKLWMILLAFALVAGLAFFGCGGGGDDDDDDDDLGGDPVELYKLSTDENIQGLTVGSIADDAGLVAAKIKDNTTDWLVMAGSPPAQLTLDVVDVGGTKGFKITTISNWGPGFDLAHPVIKFRAGDEVLVKGKFGEKTNANATTLILDAGAGGTAVVLGTAATITEDAEFELKATLTAADVTAIGKADPPCIRIKGGQGNQGGGITFTISEIVITGVPRGFTAVTGIEGVPASVAVGTDIELPEFAEPVTANNRKIDWTLVDAGTTGATLDTTTRLLTGLDNEGSLKVKGVVVNGLTASSNFEKEFIIEVKPGAKWEPATPFTFADSGSAIEQLGIYPQDKSNVTLAGVTGGFSATSTSGTYKLLYLQVGTACGGTDYYRVAPKFDAVAGTSYTISFMASTETTSGQQMRLRGNGATNTTWVYEAVTPTPREITLTWTQAADGGNFHLDTGGVPQDEALTITDLKITWAAED